MGRQLIAVVVGILAAFATVALIERIGHWIYPPPPGVDLTDPDALRSLMDQVPFGAKLSVVIAWILGALAGGYVSSFLAGPDARWPILAVGTAMFAASAYPLWIIPHPVWMAALGVLTPVPCAFLGGRLQQR